MLSEQHIVRLSRRDVHHLGSVRQRRELGGLGGRLHTVTEADHTVRIAIGSPAVHIARSA